MFVSGFQFAHQVELARHEADYEQRELDELLRWLDHAEDVLQIVDRPVHDRQKEYQVNYFCNIFFFSFYPHFPCGQRVLLWSLSSSCLSICQFQPIVHLVTWPNLL